MRMEMSEKPSRSLKIKEGNNGYRRIIHHTDNVEQAAAI